MKVKAFILKISRAGWMKKLTIAPWVKYAASSFVVPAIVALSTSLILSAHDDKVAQQEKVIAVFHSGSDLFEASVSSYVNHILVEGKPDAQVTDQLTQAIVAQYTEIDDTVQYLPPTDAALIKEYKDALVQMRNVLPASDNVVDMKPFWETTSKILVLQHRIGLDLPS